MSGATDLFESESQLNNELICTIPVGIGVVQCSWAEFHTSPKN